MALPSSGQVKFSDIQTEFGGSDPIRMSEYYAGGSYVQSGATGTNGSLPTSGQISVNKFHGSQHLGSFVYTASSATTSGASGTGAGQTIHRVSHPTTTATFSSGGPISGSMTYLWSRTSASSGAITIDNTALASPTWTVDYLVPQATADSRLETWQCLVTDTVSGLTYTITGVSVGDSYTNNTG